MQITSQVARASALLLVMLVAGCGGGSSEPLTGAQPVLLPAARDADSGGHKGQPPVSVPSDPGPVTETPEPPPVDPPQDDPPSNDPPPDHPPPDHPPPDDPPPDPVPVACPTITDCLDLGRSTVAYYKGGKKAAASYTFDDGYDSSFAIASMFEARGLHASFYIVPMTIEDNAWSAWKDLHARGHEIGNHSMTHTIDLGLPETTDAQLATEITEAQRVIADRLGFEPQVFAFPWHSSTAAARALALSTHFAIRTSTPEMPFTLAFFDQDHGTPDVVMATVNRQLDETIAAGGWYVAAGHGIDGDGWSPVTGKFLNDHLDYAQRYSDKLWTDTFLNVARYHTCRKQATVTVEYSSSLQVRVKLDGEFGTICTEPLTLRIPTLMSGTLDVVARDANGAQLTLKKIKGALVLDVLPGQTVNLEAAR